METIIALVVILLIFVLAITKIVVEKKKGAKCVGCSVYKNKSECSSCK